MEWLIVGVGGAGVLMGYIIGFRERRRITSRRAREYWIEVETYLKRRDDMKTGKG